MRRWSLPASASALGRSVGVLGSAGVALMALALLAGLVWLRPLQREVAQLRAQLAQDQTALRLPGRPDGERLAALIATLPARPQLPDVLGKVVAQARAAGLELESGHYEYTTAGGAGLARYELHLPVRGTYAQVRSFTDGVLAAVPAVALVGMSLERETIGSAELQADLRFAVLVRQAP
ncbi:MAG: type 4a pilus biogenesis protein PilO [Steroidobacteraceae bacterium]